MAETLTGSILLPDGTGVTGTLDLISTTGKGTSSLTIAAGVLSDTVEADTYRFVLKASDGDIMRAWTSTLTAGGGPYTVQGLLEAD